MTKALSCLNCGTVRTFRPDGSSTTCDCGLVVGWWVDAALGLAKMHVMDPTQKDQAQVVLIHNGFLRAGHDMIRNEYTMGEMDILWRQLHLEAQAAPRWPESLQVFGVSRRGCPLVIQRPGESPDTLWASEPELRDRGLLKSDGAVQKKALTSVGG